jgi:hypothetical protein
MATSATLQIGSVETRNTGLTPSKLNRSPDNGPDNYIVQYERLLGGSHPPAENRRWFSVRLSIRTVHSEAAMRACHEIRIKGSH